MVVSGKAGLVGCRRSDSDMEQLLLGAAVGFQAAVPNVGADQFGLGLGSGLGEELVLQNLVAVIGQAVVGRPEELRVRRQAVVRFALLDS